MELAFAARQSSVGSSELERLCNLWSADVREIANVCGSTFLPGQMVSVDVGGAINILILSTARSHGVEIMGMRQWLPKLRNETLLQLASRLSNWRYEGPAEHNMAFNATLWGTEAEVRSRLAPLFGISLVDTASLLRFHSQADVECLSRAALERGHSGRPALFEISPWALASRIEQHCRTPLFIGRVKVYE